MHGVNKRHEKLQAKVDTSSEKTKGWRSVGPLQQDVQTVPLHYNYDLAIPFSPFTMCFSYSVIYETLVHKVPLHNLGKQMMVVITLHLDSN